MNSTVISSVGPITTKIALSSCILSIIGGFCIIYTYIKIENLRNSTPRKLLVYITCADILSSVGYIVGISRYKDLYPNGHVVFAVLVSDNLCKSQSLLTTYGSISSFIWTDLLAIYLFLVVRYDARTELSLLQDILFQFIGWIVPGIIAVIAASYDVFGEDMSQTSGPWCWIKRFELNGTSDESAHAEQVKWAFLAGKAYEIATYLITFGLYTSMKIYLRRMDRNQEGRPSVFDESNLRREDEYFWLTWVILLVLRLPGTIRTFLFIAKSSYGTVTTTAGRYLLYFQSFGDCGQAFANWFFYCCFDEDIKDFVKMTLREYRDGLTKVFRREGGDDMNTQMVREQDQREELDNPKD